MLWTRTRIKICAAIFAALALLTIAGRLMLTPLRAYAAPELDFSPCILTVDGAPNGLQAGCV